mgnify:CR=1 FL=1|tara:strand:- start:170 stop:367 length:198 start_codon:yes stop_codon:yes gene_type:complete
MRRLSDKELETLIGFCFKVDMEGFSYALQNYGPTDKIFKKLYELPTLDAIEWLDELRYQYQIEIN